LLTTGHRFSVSGLLNDDPAGLLMVDVLMLPDGEMGSTQAQVFRYLRSVLVLAVLHHRYNSLPLAWFQAVYNLKL